jgi:hypothetical protein
MSEDERSLHYALAFCPGQAPIDAYGNGGFRFADMSHKGSLLCLPSGFYGWDVAAMSEVDAATLGLVLREAHGVEVLLIGTGGVPGVSDTGTARSFGRAPDRGRGDVDGGGGTNLQCAFGRAARGSCGVDRG